MQRSRNGNFRQGCDKDGIDHRSNYTVGQLHAAGMRMTDGFMFTETVELYCELHPEADPEAIMTELRNALGQADK